MQMVIPDAHGDARTNQRRWCELSVGISSTNRTVLMEKLETAQLLVRISIAVQRGNAASFAGCFDELEPQRQ